ncbi:MAG TPA: iron-containing alcohol dehydrogenase [Verrucomicrobiae bacterium]|nr:iron-containing alcohol dehydrogenase [Verrucomicrobiae bacterium]
MSITSFSFPTTTLFGAGALKELAPRLAALGIGRPLVVTDQGLVGTGAFRALAEVLGEVQRDHAWFVYSGVHANPVENDVREAAAMFRTHGCDGVIGFGGGSPLDVGKAARTLVKRPGFDLATFHNEPDWSDLAAFVAIPTTAGTGSEVGRSSVITLDATRRKGVIFHPELLADLVILDPELTVGLPPKLTAATGADALTHCIESYTCPVFHPMCDGIALEGIRLIVDALPKAYKDGKNIDARGKMLVAAAMGAVAFQKDVGVVHSLAHPLSTVCGMHHGLANALCLVAGMKFCAGHKPGLYRRVGIACGLEVMKCSDAEADQRTISFIAEFLAGLGLNTKLRAHGVNESRIDELVAQAMEDPCHKTNAVRVLKEDFVQLYQEVL